MSTTKIPTSVYAEITPNPNAIKFVADRLISQGDEGFEFTSLAEAKGYAPLAEQLFNFPFVQSVYIVGNFVSVTKTADADWDFITMELREFIQQYLNENEKALTAIPEAKQEANGSNGEASGPKPPERGEPTEFDEPIMAILDEYVRPAVENDGGAIEFHSFKEGTVSVVLKGACSGCPSSTITLKNGIEQLLKSMIPEVKEVVAWEG